VGSSNVKLHDWKIDAATMCTQKYLNAGPGNIGAIFIHEDLKLKSFEKKTDEFDPLQLCRLTASLDYFIAAGPMNVFCKTRDLVDYFTILLEELKDIIDIVDLNNKYCGHVAFRLRKGINKSLLFVKLDLKKLYNFCHLKTI
jgi:kynureninase